MKSYTIYDNVDGGYTIWYKYYDYSCQEFIKKSFQAKTKSLMLDFTKKLENNGYKFVGKI